MHVGSVGEYIHCRGKETLKNWQLIPLPRRPYLPRRFIASAVNECLMRYDANEGDEVERWTWNQRNEIQIPPAAGSGRRGNILYLRALVRISRRGRGRFIRDKSSAGGSHARLAPQCGDNLEIFAAWNTDESIGTFHLCSRFDLHGRSFEERTKRASRFSSEKRSSYPRSPHFPRSRPSSASFLTFLAPCHISSLLLVCRRIYTSFSYPAPSCIVCSCRLRLRCLICILQCLLSASQFPEFHHFPSPQTSRVFTLLSIPLLTCPFVSLPPAHLLAEFTIAPRFRSGT